MERPLESECSPKSQGVLMESCSCLFTDPRSITTEVCGRGSLSHILLLDCEVARECWARFDLRVWKNIFPLLDCGSYFSLIQWKCSEGERTLGSMRFLAFQRRLRLRIWRRLTKKPHWKTIPTRVVILRRFYIISFFFLFNFLIHYM